MLIIKPGGLTGKHATPSISDEFAMVFEGRVILKLQDSEQVLERGDSVTVVAITRMAEAAGAPADYVTDLRSMTQGRATSSMEFSHYAEVPASLASELVQKSKV